MEMSDSEQTACRKIIKQYSFSPAIVGYIFFETKMVNLRDLVSLLESERFDDEGIALVFLGGMQNCFSDAAAVLKEKTGWDEGRVERAMERAKLYWTYYSKFRE